MAVMRTIGRMVEGLDDIYSVAPLLAKLAELKTPAEKNRFTAKYHEGLGFRGASGKGATAAEALAHAERAAK